MLKVTNHNHFRHFDYENEPSPSYQLGDVVLKQYEGGEDEPEIGVVIQTFSDGDFRTDMFGMASVSEVKPATMADINKYRPTLKEYLLIQ